MKNLEPARSAVSLILVCSFSFAFAQDFPFRYGKQNDRGSQITPAESSIPFDRSPYRFPVQIKNSKMNPIAGLSADSVWQSWSVRYGSQSAPGEDWANAITIDDWDNVVVTGRSNQLPLGTVFLTKKYNSVGIELWSASYGGSFLEPANNPTGVVVDHSRNVYVAGTSAGDSTDKDFALVKYSSTGVEQWVVRYDGPAGLVDEVVGVMIDDSANVTVAGSSMSTGEGLDFTVIQYDSSGKQRWMARYNGPLNLDDSIVDAEIGPDGRIVCTGKSQTDYLTVAYDRSGNLLWTARYDGGTNFQDDARAVAVDRWGNVAVTGFSRIYGTAPHYTTVKYDSLGVQMWARVYINYATGSDFPYDVAIDSSGSVYVTGMGGNSLGWGDMSTVKYDSTGVQQWSDSYNGPMGDYDNGVSIRIDSYGSIFVAGNSRSSGVRWAQDDYVVIKYRPDGTRQWLKRYNGPENGYDFVSDMALGSEGALYVTGASEALTDDYDFATVKFDSAGVQKWAVRYSGPSTSQEFLTSVKADRKGNAYLAAISGGKGTWMDYLTVKVDSMGAVQWAARYDGTAHGYDWPSLLEVDGAGNVHVAGESDGVGTDRDVVLIKYSFAGEKLWEVRYNDAGNTTNHPYTLRIDTHGNAYVLTDAMWGRDMVVLKYDKDGNLLWSILQKDLYHERMEIDDAGNVYVAGRNRSPAPEGYAVVKYDAEGVLQWKSELSDLPLAQSPLAILKVDRFSNVYLAAKTRRGTMGNGTTLVQYDALGGEQWIIDHGSSTDSSVTTIEGMCLDADGRIFAARTTWTPYRGYDGLSITKHDPKGVVVWEWRDMGTLNVSLNDMRLGQDGTLYVSGYSFTLNDWITLRCSSDGILKSVFPYNVPLGGSLTFDGLGNAFLATTHSGSGWSVLSLSRYEQTPLSGVDFSDQSPPRIQISENFPNPFNTATMIHFTVNELSRINVEIFNTLGQRVAVLMDDVIPAGTYNIPWQATRFPSGVYFCRLQNEGVIQTKKLLLIK